MTSGRFLIIGNTTLTGLALGFAGLGQYWVAPVAILTAANAYMLHNAGAWRQ